MRQHEVTSDKMQSTDMLSRGGALVGIQEQRLPHCSLSMVSRVIEGFE